MPVCNLDRKSTRLNSSHTVIYTLSLHDALPISSMSGNLLSIASESIAGQSTATKMTGASFVDACLQLRSEEHTSELQSHSDLHSFPTRRSSDLFHVGQSALHRQRKHCGSKHGHQNDWCLVRGCLSAT